MKLQRIVVAVDESDAGRWAARVALDFAAVTGAEVAVLRTILARPALAAAGGMANGVEPTAASQIEVERLERWLAPELAKAGRGPEVALAVTYGVPSIEICRYAEAMRADLVVLGRKRRSAKTRLLIGDTVDAVARRSRIPCLFVTPGARSMRRILAALDGTDWGLTVMVAAHRLAAATGAELRTVTVEPPTPGEPDDSGFPLARTARLQQRLRETLGRDHPGAGLEVRRGTPVEQVLAVVDEAGADTLVVGYHRGGPAGIIEAGSTGRRLLHAAPGAVLTIPL
ncbi:MAG TPA: universal stress protein [Gemmatimonadales bacterium]|nr:universal stress protein [Gemmatimonadales bacterium]